MSIVVDLPAPFGPSRATVSPGAIVMSMPRTAWTGPLGDRNVLVSPARVMPVVAWLARFVVMGQTLPYRHGRRQWNIRTLPGDISQHVSVDSVAGVADPADDDVDDVPEQMRVRRAKYDRLQADPQRAPFPVGVARTASLAELRAAYPELAAGEETGDEAGVTGRVIFIRNTGKLCFAMLREGEAQLQVMISLDGVGAESLAAWKSDVDLGDLVFVHGQVISSKRGELSVLADDWRITAKALRPLPVAHKPLSDETRVRQRYVDLIVRPEARAMVRTRAAVLGSLRATLADLDYLEVETPILQVVHGGAAARPFHTHLNAFDLDMSLRIATELYLKRCIVGGIERVYEIGPTFRNEGVDSSHSPEFTMLEAYQAYGDYDTMAELTRRLVLDAAAAAGVETGRALDGTPIDLRGEWRSVTVHDAVAEALGRAGDAGHAGRGIAPARRTRGRCAASGMDAPAKSCSNCTKSSSSTT